MLSVLNDKPRLLVVGPESAAICTTVPIQLRHPKPSCLEVTQLIVLERGFSQRTAQMSAYF